MKQGIVTVLLSVVLVTVGCGLQSKKKSSSGRPDSGLPPDPGPSSTEPPTPADPGNPSQPALGPSLEPGTCDQEEIELAATDVGRALAKQWGVAVCSDLMHRLAHAQKVELVGQGLVDISILARAKRMVTIDLRFNRIEDISPISELEWVHSVNLEGNAVVEVWPLARLPHLEQVELKGNRITDIRSLARARNLRKLDVSMNPLESNDFSWLRGVEFYSIQVGDCSEVVGPRGPHQGGIVACLP